MSSERWSKFLEKTSGLIDFVDFAGKKHTFELTGNESERIGYTLRAKEIDCSESGYEFKEQSYSSPEEAYYKLTTKIRKNLATCYLSVKNNQIDLMTDQVRGRIAQGGVVVDGKFLDWDSLADLMQPYEGWEFKLSFE